MNGVENLIKDKFCYIVRSGYLKFPNYIRKKFGIGVGAFLGEDFPNPDVFVAEDEEKDQIKIIYKFKISDLKNWKLNSKGGD